MKTHPNCPMVGQFIFNCNPFQEIQNVTRERGLSRCRGPRGDERLPASPGAGSVLIWPREHGGPVRVTMLRVLPKGTANLAEWHHLQGHEDASTPDEANLPHHRGAGLSREQRP